MGLEITRNPDFDSSLGHSLFDELGPDRSAQPPSGLDGLLSRPPASFTDASASDLPGQTLVSRLPAPDTLWNTFYIDAALDQLRAQGHAVLDEDVVRLSPFVRHHINVHGKYSFLLPELAGGRRALRNPDVDPHEDG